MEEKKGPKIIPVIVTLIILLLLFLIGYIVVTEYINPKDENVNGITYLEN